MLSNKSLKPLVLIGIILMAWGMLAAWSITDSYLGNRYGSFDPRSFAMGSASTFNDESPFAIAVNPANLSLMKGSLGLQTSLYFARNEDNRAVPLYNSFDSYIDDAVYSSNTNMYDDYAAALYGRYSYDLFNAALGFYYKPMLNFDGDYSEQVRNNYGTDNDIYPEIIAMNQIRNKGILNQAGFAFSTGTNFGGYLPDYFPLFDYTASINFGLDYSILNGDMEAKTSVLWTDRAKEIVQVVNPAFLLPDYRESLDYSLEGDQFKYGVTLNLNKRFGIGFTLTEKATLTQKGTLITDLTASNTNAAFNDTLTFKNDYILPSEMRFGLSYKPQNIMRTWFNADLEYVKWSDISKVFDDVYNIYVGVEHHVENRFPLRLGFQAVNSWLYDVETDIVDSQPVMVCITKKIITPMITAGSGFSLAKNVTVDLGFGYGWREYEAVDMFGDAHYNDRIHTGHSTALLWRNPQHLNLSNRGWENPDKVRESFISLNSGISFKW